MAKQTQGLLTEGQFVPLFGGRVFVPSGHFAESELLNGGMPELHVIRALQHFLKPGHTAIDIGANIGFVSLAMAEAVGSNGKIFAIEADPDIAWCTKATFEASNAHNVTLLTVAASDKAGTLSATLSASANTAFGHVESKHGTYFGKTAVSIPLDDVIREKVDLIKIDIEGAEYAALKGLHSTIKTHKPIVLAEFSVQYIIDSLGADYSHDLYSLFSSAGYDCRKLNYDSSLSAPLSFESLLQAHRSDMDNMNAGHIDIIFTRPG